MQRVKWSSVIRQLLWHHSFIFVQLVSSHSWTGRNTASQILIQTQRKEWRALKSFSQDPVQPKLFVGWTHSLKEKKALGQVENKQNNTAQTQMQTWINKAGKPTCGTAPLPVPWWQTSPKPYRCHCRIGLCVPSYANLCPQLLLEVE